MLFVLDQMDVNEDKQHQFQKCHRFTNEKKKAVTSSNEINFTQKCTCSTLFLFIVQM